MSQAEEVKRTVFSTFTADGESLRLFGALEVGIRCDSEKVTEAKVLFRCLSGAIYDISASTVTSLGNATGTITLTREPGVSEPTIGFSVAILQLTSPNATFTGTLDHNAQNLTWTGQWVAFRNTPMAVIRAGLQPVDTHVQCFLDLTPMMTVGGVEDAIDQAAQWSSGLYHQMILRASPVMVHWFSWEFPKSMQSEFKTSVLKKTLPTFLTEGYLAEKELNLDQIAKENERFLELASWHHLCHSMRIGQVVDRDVRNNIKDKIDDFYRMLTSAAGGDLSAAKDSYGAGETAAVEIDQLRVQYLNIITRCYRYAYLCLKPDEWTKFLDDPATFFGKIRDVLLSGAWIEHWLPKLVNAQTLAGGHLDITHQLGLIRDKLDILASANKLKDSGKPVLDVDSVIKTLATAVGQTGIALKATMIEPDSKAVPIVIDHILDDDSRRTMQAMDIGHAIMRDQGTYYDSSFEFEKIVVHGFLKDNAKKLGLYNGNLPFTCVVM